MKKLEFKTYLIYSLTFLICGLAAGVFFREFSKFLGVTNTFTVLGLVHPHLLILGTVMFIIFGLVNDKLNKNDNKIMTYLLLIYAISLGGASSMLLVRGIFDVLLKANQIDALSNGINGMIAGLSGMFHIILGISLVTIFVLWIKKDKVKNI